MDIVAKIGTSSLTDDRGEIRRDAIAKLCDEVATAMVPPSGHRDHKKVASASISRAAELKTAAARRGAVEAAVADTLEKLLDDAEIRAAVKRTATKAATAALDTDEDVALLRATQDKVNKMVDRLRYELNLENE